jgi:probable HAF family extracellular repeat protein
MNGLRALAVCGLLAGCAGQPTDVSGNAVGDARVPSAAKAGAGLSVTSVSPDSVTQDTTLDIHVLGSGFDASAQAQFLLSGQPDPRVRTNSTRFVKSTEVVANVTVAIDATPARYDAQVTLLASGKKGIGTELLTVLAFADLGTFGGLRSSAGGVNYEGSLAGRSDTTGGLGRAFVWDARTGTSRSLGPLEAYDINNSRTVVGTLSGVGPVAWRYDVVADAWTYESLVTADPSGTFPTAINDLGQITGWGGAAIAGVHTGALLWQSPDVLLDLDPGKRWSYSQALGLNTGGMVVGYGRNAIGAGDAFVWIPDVPNGSTGILKVLPRFGSVPDHHAEGVNDAGDVVGWAETAQGVDYALLWRRNPARSDPGASDYYFAPENLGAALSRKGRAFDINNAMLVVGRADQSKNRFNYDPFVWSTAYGMRILPAPPGGDARVMRLNESSPAIAGGEAMVTGNWHAIRWQLP